MILDRLSIRVRITAGTLIVAGAFLACGSVLVHGAVASTLQRASAAVLRSDAAPYAVALETEPGDSFDSPGEGQQVSLIDPDGDTHLSTLSKSLTAHRDRIDLAQTDPQEVTVRGTDYLVLVTDAAGPGGTWKVVTAHTETASQLALDGITTGLGWGVVALTLLVGATSWLLTGAALSPISRLRRSAEALVDQRSLELLPVGAAHDEVSDLASTLNRLIEQLRLSADRERQLVSDASHELRTPLAILQAQLELLRTGDRSTLTADLVSAEAAAARLGELVANLLELSRLESTASTDSATPAELVDELAAAADRARFTARASDIDIEFSATTSMADAGGGVRLSPHDFGRIVDNLTSNSIRALGQHGTVTIALDIDGAAVHLEVTDDGPGIAATFLPRAFDRFSGTGDGRPGGTGLGLAIVRAAVRRAGGTVELRNLARDGRSQGGLSARVTLPLVPLPLDQSSTSS